MLLMGIREYAETRNINAKRIRALIADGKLAAGRENPRGNWLLNVAKCDEYFATLTEPKEEAPVVRRRSARAITGGNDFLAALKQMAAAR